MDGRARSPRPAPRWLAIGLAASVGVLLWSLAGSGAPIDFYQFRAVARAVDEGIVTNPWAAASRPLLAREFAQRTDAGDSAAERAAARFRGRSIDAVSTPFLYTVFHQATSDDFDRDLARYRLAQVLCFVLALLSLCQTAGCPLPLGCALIAFAGLAFPPVRFDIAEGNVNALQLGAVALVLELRARPGSAWRTAAAGAVLGAAVAFKPNLAFAALLLGVAWLAFGRTRDATLATAGGVLAAGLAVLASARFFGSAGAWLDWWRALTSLEREIDVGVHWGNFAGGRLLAELTGVHASPLLLGLALGGVAWALWRQGLHHRASPGAARSTRLEALAVSAGLLVPLVAGGLAWPHYLVLALPAVVVLAGSAADPSHPEPGGLPTRVLLVAGVLGISASLPLGALGLTSPWLHAGVLWTGSAALLAACLWELRVPPGGQSSPGRQSSPSRQSR